MKSSNLDIFFDVLDLKQLYTIRRLIDLKIKAYKGSDQITIDFIQNLICLHFKITVKDLNKKCREDKYVKPRQIGMFFCRKYCKKFGDKSLSLKEIAQGFKRKTHADVIHAIKTVNNLIETDKTFAREISKIDNKIKKQIRNEI